MDGDSWGSSEASDGDASPASATLDLTSRALNSNQLSAELRRSERAGDVGEVRRLLLSDNQLSCIADGLLCRLGALTQLQLKHNRLHDASLPKDLVCLRALQHLNLSGNCFTVIPLQVLQLYSLVELHMGANQLLTISPLISQLNRLRILYLGGNRLQLLPDSLGQLQHLQMLALCDNQLSEVPASISRLTRLKTLLLHANRLATLPASLVTLRGLRQLSIRDNPLIRDFVRAMPYDVPSLVELAARAVTLHRIVYSSACSHTSATNSSVTVEDNVAILPATLSHYLRTAKQCVNKHCKGVYFDSRVEDVQFVDCCGLYHVPLVRYLCSSHCDTRGQQLSDDNLSDHEDDASAGPARNMRRQQHRRRLRRVLLG